MDEKILEEIGLTRGEIKIYLALLKFGESTTGKIIHNAEISSGKVYEILDKLIKKGLCSFIVKENTKYFLASSPTRILDYLHEKETEIKKKEQIFLKQLPDLLAIEKFNQSKYETVLFKGFKGIKTAIFEALEELSLKDEILAMGISGHKKEQYNLLWQNWHKERINKKINSKLIFSGNDSNYSIKLQKMKLTEIRFLSGITPSAIDIIGERVLIFTYDEEVSCLSIRNPEIVLSFKVFFNSLWDISNKK